MYNKDGDSLRAFNSRRYGNISFLDCTDPYKILAFFSDYNVTLILDNFLSENGPPMAARTKPLNVIEAVDASDSTEIVSFELPAAKGDCKYVDADNPGELLELLRNEAKVL